MPATAAIDNETLDHLLSVVTDSGEHIGVRGRFGRVGARVKARFTKDAELNRLGEPALL